MSVYRTIGPLVVFSIDQHESKSCISLGYNSNNDIILAKHKSRQEPDITFFSVELHAVDMHQTLNFDTTVSGVFFFYGKAY